MKMGYRGHIGMGCKDLGVTIRFFMACGFDVAFRDDDARCACLENDRFEVNLKEVADGAGYFSERDPLHVGFQVPDLQALGELRDRLASTYDEVAPIRSRDDGDHFFFLFSPDGFPVEFFAGTHAVKRARYGATTSRAEAEDHGASSSPVAASRSKMLDP